MTLAAAWLAKTREAKYTKTEMEVMSNQSHSLKITLITLRPEHHRKHDIDGLECHCLPPPLGAGLTQEVVGVPRVHLIELRLVPHVLGVQVSRLLVVHPVVEEVPAVCPATPLVPLLSVEVRERQPVSSPATHQHLGEART